MMEVQGPLSLSIITPLTKESHSLPISFFGSMREEEEEDEDEDDDNEADAEQSNIAKKTKKAHSDASLVASLKACTQQKDLAKGIKIHAHTVKRGLFRNNHHITSAIVNMYAKCGALLKAQETFDDISSRNTVLWTSLIAGYAQHGYGEEALVCFECMQEEGFLPDVVTFLSVLRACGSLGYAHKGKRIHALIVKKDGVLEKNVIIGNALVDMYVKCGLLAKAREVLEVLPIRNLVSWSALVLGYAQSSLGHEALNCLERMEVEGIFPDEVILLGVLSACSHSGLLDEAQIVFRNMIGVYEVTPSLEHHICMVMIFGFAGQFDKAMSVIKIMPSSDHVEIWLALLDACRRWGNVKLGTLAFDQIIQINNNCASAYIIIANIFAAAGMQEDAEKVKAMRLKYAPAMPHMSPWTTMTTISSSQTNCS